jgi:ribonuclease D
MSDTNMGQMPENPTVITELAPLQAFCERAAKASYVVIDTEFLRETTYWPILCLVQVAIGDDLLDGEVEDDLYAAIDPMPNGKEGELDLTPLYDLMANEKVLKVFHAARQDLEIFFKGMGKLPHPVFDTQVAAMVCGFGDSVGYENLLTRLTGAKVDKGARFTDWSIRPLSRRQIDYALADVVYLKPAYLKLCKLLEDGGRAGWIDEEMRTLLNPEIYDVDPMATYKRIKARNAKPRTLAVLRELAAWRETEARRKNIPRNRMLRDEALLEIAHHTPKDANGLGRTRGMGARMAEGQAGQEILKAVQRGVATPDKDCPKPATKPDLPRGIGPTSDLLKVLLKIKCEDYDVAQKLIASSDDIELIAAYGEKADVRAMHNWRFDVFGNDALRIRNGECAIAMKNKKLILLEI